MGISRHLSRLNLILVSILLILSLTSAAWAATYYVDATGGNDSNSGLSTSTAWKTIAKVNASKFSPGDQILFKRGATWREQLTVLSSGSSGNPITFGAYGSGTKPKILGSIDFSAPGSWTYEGGNLWYATSAVQIGNMIFNNETSVGFKKSQKTDLTTQGHFWWDDSNDRVYLYSTSSPGTFYTAIEAAKQQHGILIDGSSYITIDGFDIRYAGGDGIKTDGGVTPCKGIIIQNCDLSWIGGVYLSGTTRYGNAIEIWAGASDVIVRYNRVNQAYDDGITWQNNVAGKSASNVSFYYNIVSNCHTMFDYFQMGTGATSTGILVYNNVGYNAGGSWSEPQRPDPYPGCFNVWNSNGRISSSVFKNNICYLTTNKHVWFPDSTDLAGWTMDYNLYYPDGGAVFMRNAADSTNFAGWKTATGKDAHSKTADPLFVSTSDFHLQSTSPAIDAGTNAGLTTDYEGKTVPFGPAPDIGAYEYHSRPLPLQPPTGLRRVP